MIYSLSAKERTRLMQGVRTALAIPFIAGVEDYVWEAAFHYVKELPLPDPHADLRRKLLFDAVDKRTGIGWSLKSHQGIPSIGANFEVVIQRADILDKRVELGFPNLTLDSEPREIGAAVLAHWKSKIRSDSNTQGVASPRIAILLKSSNHRRYALLEQDLAQYSKRELIWSWTDGKRKGLQAKHKRTGRVVYRWYRNQKQLFEAFTLAAESFHFEVDSSRMEIAEFVELLVRSLK